MKYQLSNLIKNLNHYESRTFKSHSNRFKSKKDKKITLIYNSIKYKDVDEYDENIREIACYDGSKGAFAKLKNQLTEEIEDSLIQLHKKKHSEFKVYRNLQLFQLSWDKSLFKEAKQYLKKAEKTAKKIENYELLSLITKKLIQIAPYLHDDPTKYIQQQNHYHDMMLSINQLDHLLASINYKISQTNFLGKNQRIVQELEEMSSRLLQNEAFRNSAEVKLKIYQSIRNVLLQKRDYHALCDYLIDSYDNFETHKVYVKANFADKIVHISWIVNALLKIKRYKEVPQYTDELFKALLQYDRVFYYKYIWQYCQSRMLQYTFSGKNLKAIELLLAFEREELHTQPESISLYLNLNLCSLYYTAGQYEHSLESLAKILTDTGFNKLNEEFQLRLLIIELIVRFDNKDIAYAYNKSREIKRKFNHLLKQDLHTRDQQFINILTDVIRNPDSFKDKRLLAKAQNFIQESPEFEPGSNEVIDYAVWLKSKIQRKTYYELIPRLFE